MSPSIVPYMLFGIPVALLLVFLIQMTRHEWRMRQYNKRPDETWPEHAERVHEHWKGRK